jgi:steroid 5-alpha reductase family enzyme
MLTGYERYTGLLSPVFVTFLLSFVSGIPLLERQAKKLFGSDAAYHAYRNKTPVLIPFINFPRV